MPLTLRVDPWASEYEGALQIDEEQPEPSVPVDPFVETTDWDVIVPSHYQRPEAIVFIDGVQRVEVRVIGDHNGALIYGAFASLAVGAVLARLDGALVETQQLGRVLALGGGVSRETVTIPCGTHTLQFAVRSTAATAPWGFHEAVQAQRREEETRLGQAMVEQGYPLVIVDGRLSFQPTRRSTAVGLVKTMHYHYLEAPQVHILSQLETGTRTPLFRIPRDQPMYSWYVRLNQRRSFDHSWAGLARLETLEGIGLEAAMRLADLTAGHLPAFASTAAWEPRAPQNLYPLSALEDDLHHRLGDHTWIRRSIETHLHQGGVV